MSSVENFSIMSSSSSSSMDSGSEGENNRHELSKTKTRKVVRKKKLVIESNNNHMTMFSELETSEELKRSGSNIFKEIEKQINGHNQKLHDTSSSSEDEDGFYGDELDEFSFKMCHIIKRPLKKKLAEQMSEKNGIVEKALIPDEEFIPIDDEAEIVIGKIEENPAPLAQIDECDL
uniref:Uncharacterized protein n=1 Tax=Acrobeloides nanus TaxID=290746 RepID=A0A914E709_9BILA